MKVRKMSSKIKKHQSRKPRNHALKQNILDNKGGPMKDRRERRLKEREIDWKREDFGE